MIEVVAVHKGVDDQLTQLIRREFINVAPLCTDYLHPHVYLGENVFVRLVYQIAYGAREFATIDKDSLGITLEHPAPDTKRKRLVARQHGVGIGSDPSTVDARNNPP